MGNSTSDAGQRSLASLQAGVMSAVVFVVACFAAAIVFSAYPADARSPEKIEQEQASESGADRT